MRKSAPEQSSQTALPTGVITLLFTDIAGSSRMWEEHGDRFIPVWQTHDAILRDAFAQFHGYEVKTEGDAFMVAFSDPVEALNCALSVQSALARYPWPPDIGPLRVRMGLHTGEPFVHGNDYFGPMVNRAAHICNSGQGGQILLSEETYRAVLGKIDPKIEMDDLGDHRLKDLGTPQRLYQASYPGSDLAGSLPPRTLEGQPNNLPVQRTSFVGRAKEIEQIASYLAKGEKPVLTLTGPGGIGKTRLSLQAAAATAEWFPDGVWYIKLVEARDIVGAAVEIASAMHIPLNPANPPLPQVRAWLADRRCLLILDDAGTLPHADRLLRELLSGASNLRCLATARESLQITDADEMALTGLPTTPLPDQRPEALVTQAPEEKGILAATDAGRLFLERRAEAYARLNLPPEEIEALDKLIGRLEGVPVFIERAAKLIDSYPPSVILEWLNRQIAPHRASADSVPQAIVSAPMQPTVQAGVEKFKGIIRRGAQAVSKVREEARPAMNNLGHFVQAIANVATDRHEAEQAVELGRTSLQLSQQTGDEMGVAAALRQLARTYWQEGNRESAVGMMSAAVQIYRHHQAEDMAEIQHELDHYREQMGQDQAKALPAPTMAGAIAMAMGEKT